MTLAAFLPTTAVAHVRAVVQGEPVLNVASWDELDAILQNRWFASVLFDPGTGGVVEILPAISLITKHRSIPFLAYVPLTAESLVAVAKLSNFGLAAAIVHPAPGTTIMKVVDRAFLNPYAHGFLGTFEASFAKLPAPMVTAILDLFRRPQRYSSGTDIAREAGIPPRTLDASLRNAELGTAKKLVILAKLLRGYSYLRDSRRQVGHVCKSIGYSHRRLFAEHSRAVFGCSPSKLSSAKPDEVLVTALEWLYRPNHRDSASGNWERPEVSNR